MITTLYAVNLPRILIELKGKTNVNHTEEVIQGELGRLYFELEKLGARVNVTNDVKVEEIK